MREFIITATVILTLLLLTARCGREGVPTGARGCLSPNCTLPGSFGPSDIAVDSDLEEVPSVSPGDTTIIVNVPPAPPTPIVITLPPEYNYVCAQKVPHSSRCFKRKGK